MAEYHLSTKIISRKAGRSSTAAAAYRAGEQIVDKRTGEIHDYTKKAGVMHSEVIMPEGCKWQPDRAELWNAVEAKNKRADAQVAREFVVALPHELDENDRRKLAQGFARHIANEYSVAADLAIHAPSKQGDQRNYHAHILTTTNKLNEHGDLGNKARELDAIAHGMNRHSHGQRNEIDRLRETWADMQNARLKEAGISARVDHRSLAAQGIERQPTQHLGPTATAIERRTKQPSRKRLEWQERDSITAYLASAREIGERERQDTLGQIIDTETKLDQVLRDKGRLEAQRRAMALAHPLSWMPGAMPERSQQGKTPEQIREELARAAQARELQPAKPLSWLAGAMEARQVQGKSESLPSREAVAWAERLKEMQETGKAAPVKTGQQEQERRKPKAEKDAQHSRATASAYKPAHEREHGHGLGR